MTTDITRWWDALCQHCSHRHTLDNDRVWAGCGLWRVIRETADSPGLEEREVLDLIRGRFGPPEKKE